VLGYNIGCDKSPDGKILLSGSSDGKLTFYDYYTTKVMKRIDTGFSVCLDVAYHPVLSNTVACCSWDGQISLWQ
jgi:WD40 repeat protein